MNLISKAFFSGIARIFAQPRLSLPLVVTLGLTLGAVLSVVAMSSALLYKPLKGVKNEESIQSFEYRLVISDTISVSYWNMRRLSAFNKRFKDLGTWAGINSTRQEAQVNDISYGVTQHDASNTILEVLGTRLIKGQDVTIEKPEESIWISESLWKQAFAGLDNAIGKQVTVNGKSYVVAGIIEDLMEVQGAGEVLPQQVWIITDLKALIGKREVADISNELDMILLKSDKPNVTVPSKDDVKTWVTEYIKAFSDPSATEGYLTFINNTPINLITSNYRGKLLGDTSNLITALTFAVLGLLVMATLNLLNLFVAHYQGRTKEFAIQLTTGASLFKLRLLVFVENLPSFILASIAGLLVTGWVIRILPVMVGSNFPLIDTIGLDSVTLASAVIIVLVLSALFSCLALVDINTKALAENLNSSGKGLQAQSNQWLSRGLMVIQLSIASILLTASVMIAIQSYQAVYRDLGYEIGNSFEVFVFNADQEWAAKLAEFEHYEDSELKQLHEGINRVIESEVSGSEVVINSFGPLSDNFSGNIYFPEDAPDQRVIYHNRHLTHNFFESVKIPMLAGSNLTEEQIKNKERRVVMDTTMAKILFPNLSFQEIIGKSVKLQQDAADGTFRPPYIINGIVPATLSRAGSIRSNQIPAVYFATIGASRNMALTVRLPEGRKLTADMFEAELIKQYPRLDNIQVTSLNELWERQTANQRMSLWLVLIMTGLTLLLAAIGVAGLTQMTTNHRKYELAVRMATGAKQLKLVNLMLKDASSMLTVGLGLGFIISVLVYQQAQSQLDILPSFNWLAMLILDIGLVAIVVGSVVTPVWRVISGDPMQALREE